MVVHFEIVVVEVAVKNFCFFREIEFFWSSSRLLAGQSSCCSANFYNSGVVKL